MDEAIADIQARLGVSAIQEFDELVAHTERPLEVVAYFLAVLELARWGALRVSQPDQASAIKVTKLEGVYQEEIDAMSKPSEWGSS